MTKCGICKNEKNFLSEALKVCLDCIRGKPKLSKVFIKKAHAESRQKYNLPAFPPKTKGGIKCKLCANECQIGEGEKGYCGLRECENGKLKSKVSAQLGLLYFYKDPLPTNCCASWFCEGSKARGKRNLAVFFYGCSFNCLFCQNYSHKLIEIAPKVSVKELLKKAEDPSVFCVCFFGGSPEPQLLFAINFSRKILKKRKIKICFEWNGSTNEKLLREAAKISLESGGIIKFDLKAFNENLNYALCGVSNKRVFKNFEIVAKEFLKKAKHPMLCATTLLVPGYVDEIEVEKISKFIAKLNPEIPYSLLVFYPQFYMKDLPITPKEEVFKCFEIAKKYLKNVHIGNLHLLNL
jgi:pyruvate formate lyase activating enzyme